VHDVVLGLTIIVGLFLFFLPTIIAITRDAKRRDTEPARSWPIESDTWNFDPVKLSDRSAEPKDHWVLS
jgi:hypothetical protein